ncbi:MAG: heavy metal translocating P-type ATPase [Myxococcota bacterium]
MVAESCAHCGLPVPPALVEEGAEQQFCCHGCRTVYEVIHASGFDAYYRLREEAPGTAIEGLDQSFEELDDPGFIERDTQALPDGVRQVELHLEGVHCSACLWLIETSLARLEGVGEARLDFGRGRLRLTWAPERVPLSKVARHLARLGYRPHPSRLGGQARQRETRDLVVRIGVAGAVAGNVMLMAFALYGGWLSGMADEHRQLFRTLSALASLPAVLYSAWPFYRSAWAGLRAGVLHMDLPISIGILAGFAGGLVNVILGEGEIYFDSVTTLIFLLLVGRLLQTHQQRRATESSELIYALTPSSATRIEAEGDHKVPLHAIKAGDHLRIAPGEVIPVDGFIKSGQSAVDLSLLTGESHPVPVKRDDEVWGGTTNLEAELEMLARFDVRSSRVGKIADMVETAVASKAPVVQLADRVAGGFVGTVLGLALLTFVLWSWIEPGAAVDRAVALLIVSCPCALGLATPLALTAAIGKAARRGILVRSGSALEALGRMRRGRVFFDKTGTLTHGRMAVVRFEGPDWVGPLVSAAERESTHPVGRALRRAWNEDAADVILETVETVPGGGLVARVEGRDLVIGSPKWVASRVGDVPASLRRDGERAADEGLTPVWIAVDGRVRAFAGLADEIREGALESVRALEARGLEVAILSGDHPAVVDAVGGRLGLDLDRCHGGLTPEDKLAFVEAAAWEGPVIMVGDGVNDAAALARATVGVAVHGGAETCFQAADVFLRRAGVEPLVDLVDGARRTYRTLFENVLFSLTYNAGGAALAMLGALNPLIAAILMPISSLVVVTRSFRYPFGAARNSTL